MKRLLYIILLIVGVAGLGLASYLGYDHYKERTVRPILQKDAQKDSVQIAKMFEQVNNPEMNTPESVYYLRTKMIEADVIDSIFLSIPPNVIVNVANVAIGNKGKVTKKDIVEEYMKNYEGIYRHLKLPPLTGNPDPLPNSLSPETIRVPLPPVIEVDTIINGHHVKLIKMVESNG